ncbi:RdRP-domain-containing protein [Irpex rosettiformis]|uniref:RdRP-domain-containing protein n=1 Tax=Irpex rosettiformis TaxID=378272 RepID=A0ACB8UIJ0_9APHY|nr:RdRP-domain-containing protein [Irpex rosettiformis]
MELDLKHVPFEASNWDVKRAFGEALHGAEFYNASDPKARPINFDVQLNKSHGVQNNGTGVLTLPDRSVGQKLFKLSKTNELPVTVKGKKIYFTISGKKPMRKKAQTLEKTPYLPPEIEEEREEKLQKLDVGLHVDKLQFGVFYRERVDLPEASRRFSNEYELSHKDRSAGFLQIEYDHKLIRIRLGSPMTEDIAYNVVIKFGIIRRLAVGLDFGNPFICFELFNAPVFQSEWFNRSLTGDSFQDNKRYRQRLSSLNGSHGAVASHAYQLRVILHEPRDLEKFSWLCGVAGISRPFRTTVEASANGFFSSRRLFSLQRRIKAFEWSVAFQIEALLRSGLINPGDLETFFLKRITQLCTSRPLTAADTLRHYTEALRTRSPRESIWDCFEQVVARETPEEVRLHPGLFRCHHVTVTPSRLVLEGPYIIQSNRVIRQYEGFEEQFIRVDFRDEDRLHFRWERDTDGASVLHERVGETLKNGFELAGKQFEFLAYSSSALREHAVWFISPFKHPKYGWVDAAGIRKGLGTFDKVSKSPSKLAARMAQAFTATDPSVEITVDQWKVMEDIGEDSSYLHTDGVGTISRQLGDMIWDALCEGRDEYYKKISVKPSAYQIRFLGCKGMVSVDPQLEGVMMCVRNSMVKFDGHFDGGASIEIAHAFERPTSCYMNRPIIMVLEDRGVTKKAFLKLQQAAIASIHMSSDTVLQARQLFREQQLGGAYRLPFIFQCLSALGMGMEYEKRAEYRLNDPFLERTIQFAKNHVLRDIKHGARIPIPGSHHLVGVADEGPAYKAAGFENVYCLPEAHIFACVQKSADEEPIYIEGQVSISRSPVVHPGDVQIVHAIGKPPENQLCIFRDLKNCVVLPTVGKRSLASMLGGGDLDGDMYSIIIDGSLLPTEYVKPANYEGMGTRTLDREATIDDICDFVVEYINSDVLGLLADRHLIIADQSKEGTFDKECMELAQLCSQAVDYPKNGIPVDLRDSPRWLIPFKPDWKKPEEDTPHRADYYESDRALGELFRNVKLLNISGQAPYAAQGSDKNRPPPLSDQISQALRPHIESMLGAHGFRHSDADVSESGNLFRRYVDELKYICLVHALSDSPDSRLVEEEIVIGTILAHCSETRFRKDRMYRMRLHAAVLVDNTRKKLWEWKEEPTEGELRFGLVQAWRAWDFGMRNRGIFGANSFALVALGVICNILQTAGCIDVRATLESKQGDDEDDNENEDSEY